MKKIISLITGVLISTTFISCNSTKVLEKNTKNNKELNKYKITERNINIDYEDKIFEPLFYDEDGVNGLLDTRKSGFLDENEIDVPYILKESGELIKEEKKYFAKEGRNFINRNGNPSYKGLYSEGLHTRGHTFYYMDLKKDISFKLDGYNDLYYDIMDLFEYKHSNYFQINDDYFIEEIYNMTEDYETKGEKFILIIDLKNQTYYTSDVIKMDPNVFYYDKKEDSLMALDSVGKIKKITLKDKEIYIEDFEQINISNLGINSLFDTKKPMFNRYIISEDNLIFYIGDKYIDVIYNINTKELKYMKEGINITTQIEDTKFFVITTSMIMGDELGNKVYLAEINDNYEFDLIYKLSLIDSYSSLKIKANESKDSIFFALESFDFSQGGGSILKESKYFFIEIEEN